MKLTKRQEAQLIARETGVNYRAVLGAIAFNVVEAETLQLDPTVEECMGMCGL